MEGSNIKPIITTEEDKISNTFYVNFRSVDLTGVFIYAIIVLISIYISQQLNLNIYLTLILVFSFIFLDISKNYVYNTVKKDHLSDELKAITPHPLNIDKYPDIINLFHGLGRLSELNFVEFSSVVYNTDAVIQIYNDALIGLRNCKQNYDIAKDRAVDAFNALHNLIYGDEVDPTVSKKYHDSLDILHKILGAFLDKIKRTCEIQRHKEGWNHNSQIIFPGPLSANESYFKIGSLNDKTINLNNINYF